MKHMTQMQIIKRVAGVIAISAFFLTPLFAFGQGQSPFFDKWGSMRPIRPGDPGYTTPRPRQSAPVQPAPRQTPPPSQSQPKAVTPEMEALNNSAFTLPYECKPITGPKGAKGYRCTPPEGSSFEEFDTWNTPSKTDLFDGIAKGIKVGAVLMAEPEDGVMRILIPLNKNSPVTCAKDGNGYTCTYVPDPNVLGEDGLPVTESFDVIDPPDLKVLKGGGKPWIGFNQVTGNLVAIKPPSPLADLIQVTMRQNPDDSFTPMVGGNPVLDPDGNEVVIVLSPEALKKTLIEGGFVIDLKTGKPGVVWFNPLTGLPVPKPKIPKEPPLINPNTPSAPINPAKAAAEAANRKAKEAQAELQKEVDDLKKQMDRLEK